MDAVCEVCLNTLSGPILTLGAHPLCDDLISIGHDPEVTKYLQELKLCKHCLTAHQVYAVEKELLFKPDYHYRAGLTRDVLKGMEDLVEATLPNIVNLRTPVILDVGCNDGSLLGIFKNIMDCITIGVDPTDAILSAKNVIDYPIQEYFNEHTARSIIDKVGFPDLITFTNVFAHIEDLVELLNALKILIKPGAILIVENHYLGAILENSQFDSFYHEHPRTYSAKSFEFISKSLGMSIEAIDFPSRYGGNIRVTMRKQTSTQTFSLPTRVREQEDAFLESFILMQDVYEKWKIQAVNQLAVLIEKGPIFGKALPGRAVMLISALNITEKEMPVLFEQPNSPKVGFYVPNTRIEILNDTDLMNLKPDRIIVWAWHIIEEVCQYLLEIGFKGEVWVPLPRFELFRVI